MCSFGADRNDPAPGEIYALYAFPVLIGAVGLANLIVGRDDAAEICWLQVNLSLGP